MWQVQPQKAKKKKTQKTKRSSIAVSCGVGCRYGLDPVLLWLWCRLAAAALIQPLDWELPYAVRVTLKSKKKEKEKRRKENVFFF